MSILKKTLTAALITLTLTTAMKVGVAQQGGVEKVTIVDRAAAQLELIREPFEKRRQLLFSQYADAVDRLGIKFQQDGQLQNVIDAKAEAESVRTSGKVGEKALPGIDGMREALARELLVIEQEESVAVAGGMEQLIKVLRREKTKLTKQGKLQEAVAVDASIKRLQKGVSASAADAVPEALSLKKYVGAESDPILSRFDAQQSLARTAKVTASSYYETRRPEFVITPDRKDKLADLEQKEWAMKAKPGWLQVDWEDPVAAKHIVLLNRLTKVGADRWTEGRILVNGTEVGSLDGFGGQMLVHLELKSAVLLKSVRLEVIVGSQAPGLNLFEVYLE